MTNNLYTPKEIDIRTSYVRAEIDRETQHGRNANRVELNAEFDRWLQAVRASVLEDLATEIEEKEIQHLIRPAWLLNRAAEMRALP